MLENLPWIIAGLVVGLFVGYGFGKYRGASEASEELELEEETAQAKTGQPAQASSPADADSLKKVFIRRGGSHFHRENCRHIRRRGGQAISKGEALSKGFRRCPNCRP